MDVLIIYASMILAYYLRFFSFLTTLFPITKGIPAWGFYQDTFLIGLPVWIYIFYKFDFYRIYTLPLLDDIIRVIQAVSIGVLFLVLASFFYRDFSYSRLMFLYFWGTSTILLSAYRQTFKFATRHLLRPVIAKDGVLVVGKENQMLKAILKQCPHYQVYYFPYEESDVERIKTMILDKEVSQVIFTNEKWTGKKLLEVYDWCESVGVDLKLVPDLVQLCRGEISIDSSLRIPVFHLKPESLSGVNFYFKRVVDLIIATLFISFLWPILFFIAFMIKLDSKGPFLYHHKRMGYRSQTFNFYKFRTMVTDADILLEQFKAKSERKGPVFKMANDPRITKIGKVLRRYSLDELPQLINVLRGEMSLVGPRPQVLWEAAAYDDWAKRRLRVLPGITGLWQVSGRAALSYEEMIELDIYYIENWSPGLDFQILYKTIPAVFSKKGAY